MILRIINVMIDHDIYLNCKLIDRLIKPTKKYNSEIFDRDFQQKSINDDDQESGTGNSIPHSPVRDQENAYVIHEILSRVFRQSFYRFFLGDIQLSLCRNLNRQPPITDEQFNAYLISYDTFVQNPKIVHDPNLVVRIGGK